MRIAARYEPRSSILEVGGDWYDSFVLPDGRIGLAVRGACAGHGIDAAADMGRLRTALAALAARTSSPGQLITYLDDFAGSPSGVDMATASYAILDPVSGALSYASAGHPPPLVREPGGATRWLLEGRSPPLGARLGTPRSEADDTLTAGTLLVLCSDGLIEHPGEGIDVGLSRLETIVHALADDLPAGDACAAVIAGMGVETDRRDDVVVMCVRFEGPAQNPIVSAT